MSTDIILEYTVSLNILKYVTDSINLIKELTIITPIR